MIHQLKKQFNTEFNLFNEEKENQIFNIKENNARIKELQEDLEQEGDLFQPAQHELEKPNLILQVNPADINVQKYLTAEERKLVEEERLKEEERLRALEGDNVGQRGLKQMMGGTLEMKKDKKMFEDDLEREEWMEKPVEDMTEEEKLKLKEFEIKQKELEEERQKQKKQW